MKLSDQVIAEICRQLQVALITGTDVVDNLRLIRLEEANGELNLTNAYAENAEANIQKMLEEVEAQQSETQEDE